MAGRSRKSDSYSKVVAIKRDIIDKLEKLYDELASRSPYVKLIEGRSKLTKVLGVIELCIDNDECRRRLIDLLDSVLLKPRSVESAQPAPSQVQVTIDESKLRSIVDSVLREIFGSGIDWLVEVRKVVERYCPVRNGKPAVYARLEESKVVCFYSDNSTVEVRRCPRLFGVAPTDEYVSGNKLICLYPHGNVLEIDIESRIGKYQTKKEIDGHPVPVTISIPPEVLCRSDSDIEKHIVEFLREKYGIDMTRDLVKDLEEFETSDENVNTSRRKRKR